MKNIIFSLLFLFVVMNCSAVDINNSMTEEVKPNENVPSEFSDIRIQDGNSVNKEDIKYSQIEELDNNTPLQEEIFDFQYESNFIEKNIDKIETAKLKMDDYIRMKENILKLGNPQGQLENLKRLIKKLNNKLKILEETKKKEK